MRNRFFFIILATLLLAAIGFNGITVHFFRNQRLALIDEQIQESTKLLLDSELFKTRLLQGAQKIDDAISDVLGGSRIGKVFIVRDERGHVLYESINVANLQSELPLAPNWITLQAEGQYVRILNSKAGPKRLLQVGLVLDQNFINWTIINKQTLLFFFGVAAAIFALAALLTLTLMSPIRLLSDHLSGATGDLKNLKDVDQLPPQLLRFTGGGFWAGSDEFSVLIGAVQRLIDRINRNYKLTRMWTLQMAHELKTPLSVIKSETEAAKNEIPRPYSETVRREVDWISETITQFLSWAELENTQASRSLHVLRLSAVVENAKSRLEALVPGRIHVTLHRDFSVAANPGHLDQLVTNLLTNALKFSPVDSRVEVEIDDGRLRIQDFGPGLDPAVLERIGEPFNLGGSSSHSKVKGHGLGLAWVSAVSKLYDWKLEFATSPTGTDVTVRFSPVE